MVGLGANAARCVDTYLRKRRKRSGWQVFLRAEGTALKIDAEIRVILERALERAKAVLNERWNSVVGLVAALLEQETLERADIERLLAGDGPVDEVPCVEEAIA